MSNAASSRPEDGNPSGNRDVLRSGEDRKYDAARHGHRRRCDLARMFVGALVEWGSTNRDTAALLISGTLALVAGGLLWWVTVPGTVRARDVFSAVGWTWLVVTLVGAVPYLLGGTFDVPGIDRSGQFVNAIFESASGYSATGSTSLTDFEHPGRG